MIIERRHIEFPDWETRFTGHGPVRIVPVEQVKAEPTPEEKPPIPHFLPRRKHGEFPESCTDGGDHHIVSNGKDAYGAYRVKCLKCRSNRKATNEEAAELRANGGRKGRRKA